MNTTRMKYLSSIEAEAKAFNSYPNVSPEKAKMAFTSLAMDLMEASTCIERLENLVESQRQYIESLHKRDSGLEL